MLQISHAAVLLCLLRSRIILTSTGAMRGSKPVDLKGIVDEAVAACTKNGHRVSKTM